MKNKELISRCEVLAKTLSEKRLRSPYIYKKVISELEVFIGDNGIDLKGGELTLTKEHAEKLFSILHPSRSHHNILKCTALNDLLEALYRQKKYKGPYLNMPSQVKRNLLLSADEMQTGQRETYQILLDDLRNPSPVVETMRTVRRAKYMLCEFIAISIAYGAVSSDFHRKLLMIKREDITFESFALEIPVDDSCDDDFHVHDNAFIRLYFPPIVEAYFLRLVLYLRKNRKRLPWKYTGSNCFPNEWRSANFLKAFPLLFLEWSTYYLKARSNIDSRIRLKELRTLSVFDLMRKEPIFLVSAFSGKLPYYAFRADHLWEAGLGRIGTPFPGTIDASGRIRNTEKTMSRKKAVLLELDQNRSNLLADKFYRTQRDKIHDVIMSVRRKSSAAERRGAAKMIESIVAMISEVGMVYEKPYLANLMYFCRWISICLLNPKMRIKSLRILASQLRTSFLILMGESDIATLSEEKLIIVIEKTLSLYESKNIVGAIKSFTNILNDHREICIRPLRWGELPWKTDRRLRKKDIKRTKPFVTFQAVENALAIIQDRYAPEQAEQLRIAIILGFYAGLRVSEITHLKIRDLIIDDGYVLRIRFRKSSSGIRNIPLSLLVPEAHLKEIVSFCRRKLNSKNSGAIMGECLFAENDPFKISIDYSHNVSDLFLGIGYDIRFHHLRHAFANWFLVRWVVAIFGIEKIPTDSALCEEVVFSEKYLQFFRMLLFGYGQQKSGQHAFTHVLAVLARVMGHIGPSTTMPSYVHIADWLSKTFLFEKERDRLISNRNNVLQDFMCLSYPSLPGSPKKSGKTIHLTHLITEQVSRLKSLMEKGRRRPSEEHEMST